MTKAVRVDLFDIAVTDDDNTVTYHFVLDRDATMAMVMLKDIGVKIK